MKGDRWPICQGHLKAALLSRANSDTTVGVSAAGANKKSSAVSAIASTGRILQTALQASNWNRERTLRRGWAAKFAVHFLL